MTLYWHSTGLLLQYKEGMLQVSNLNPEVATQSRMSRWEMVKLGFNCILAGVRK